MSMTIEKITKRKLRDYPKYYDRTPVIYKEAD